MWAAMVECIRKSANDVLGISRRGGGRIKRAWWWNEEAKKKVKEKLDAYVTLIDSRTDEKIEVRRA